MGVYDTIIFTCPNCGKKVEKQTKAGACRLAEYIAREVPIDIAVAITGEKVRCDSCGNEYTIDHVSPIPETIRMYLKEQWQPISTAPLDGTVIIGKWEDDEDFRPQQVKYIERGWFCKGDKEWQYCTPPSHWQPIN